MTPGRIEFTPPQKTLARFRMLATAGGAIVAAGLFIAPQRIWPNLLLGSYALLCLGLAGVFFIALQYVTGASWSVALRRVPEAMTAALPAGAIGIAAVLLGRISIYPWVGGHGEASEGFLGFKHAWLSQPFFLGRSAAYLAIWTLFAWALVRASRLQDSSGNLALTRRNIRVSAIFVVVFSFTFWLASFDWIMSLEPSWYSTIFGVYNFAGMFVAGLAVIALAVIWLRKTFSLEHTFTSEHLKDLGTLLFAFSTFWAYIWFSQYMLIWYADLPEETVHFVRRMHGPWQTLFVLNFIVNWAVPFLVLLPRANKQSPRVLASVSVLLLFGHALDLYLMVMPPFAGAKPVFGIWEIGVLAGTVGVFGLVFLRALRQAPLVPIGDPYLQESLHYHA
jgi:hypothetical protein